MSYSYSRVIPEPISFKQYGFHSVTSQEMYSIVRRLQAPTYNTELYHGECFKQQPCPPRNPSSYCRRAKSADTEGVRHRPEPTFTSERDLDRAYKRVRTPTLSKMAAAGKIAPSYETNFEQFRHSNQKEYSPVEQKKMTRRLQRPTTAVRNKAFCSFCNDPVLSKYHHYDFSADDDVAEPDVIEEIVDRVRAPTIASEGGIGPTCPKRRDSIGKRSTMRDIPLVCGLPRSKNIDEIVSRLYTPTEAIPICRPSSARSAKGKENYASRNHRPKSASSAIAPRFLRSLSSYSNLSSRSSASISSNRSKFSDVSDYDRNSNKKAIYISRKPPTGNKITKSEHDSSNINTSDDETKNNSGNKTSNSNENDETGINNTTNTDASGNKTKIESKNENEHENKNTRINLDSKNVTMQSDEDTNPKHTEEESENEQMKPSDDEEQLSPKSKTTITHQVKVTLPLYSTETEDESDENNGNKIKSPKAKIESSHYETTTAGEGKHSTTSKNLSTTDIGSSSDLSSSSDSEDEKKVSSEENRKHFSDDMDIVPPSLSGSSSGRSSPSNQSMKSNSSDANKHNNMKQ